MLGPVSPLQLVGSMGEVCVTFAASVELPARLVFLHPTHNFAVIQYDPDRFEPGLIKVTFFALTELVV